MRNSSSKWSGEADVKRGLFRQLEGIVAFVRARHQHSSISVTATLAQHPARLAGMHFFNPVPVDEAGRGGVGAATGRRRRRGDLRP
ncbi:MAG: 3-hydroxyacyl-CoA dehydrogenase NAD-binding domain-containing protein [Rubrivivax sp.]